MNRALLIVDVQRDFCPGGALPASGCDAIIPALNRHITEAQRIGVRVYASRDWHPARTVHFQAFGGPWPPHCVQGTSGAEFHPALALPADTIVISKGEAPDAPGYSAFEGRTPEGKLLADDLRDRGVEYLYVAGLTTDYCVKHSAVDALAAGLRVSVLVDAIAGIVPADAERALAEMKQAGAELSDTIR